MQEKGGTMTTKSSDLLLDAMRNTEKDINDKKLNTQNALVALSALTVAALVSVVIELEKLNDSKTSE